MPNPLVSDRNIAFLVDEVFDLGALCALPAFAAHSRETFTLYLDSARKLAREVLFPAFKPMDEAPPRLENGQVRVHPALREISPASSSWASPPPRARPRWAASSFPPPWPSLATALPHGRQLAPRRATSA